MTTEPVQQFVHTQKLTWSKVEEEVVQISIAWQEDGGKEVFEITERITKGWQRYIDALRSGNREAAVKVLEKIHSLQEQAAAKDYLSRRLAMLKGLLILRSLTGRDVRVAIRTQEDRI